MISAVNSAVSALQVQGTRQEVTANNVANSNTAGFEPSRVVSQEGIQGGVNASVDTPAPQEPVDASRNVNQPSRTDIATEMLESQQTTQTYKANLQTVGTANTMQGSLLDTMA
ncbi:MAG: flagellar basal body protein [Geobacteraceae bacterium]|nr:flagellar basal body protein [Geobacteraceae bacterium]